MLAWQEGMFLFVCNLNLINLKKIISISAENKIYVEKVMCVCVYLCAANFYFFCRPVRHKCLAYAYLFDGESD